MNLDQEILESKYGQVEADFVRQAVQSFWTERSEEFECTDNVRLRRSDESLDDYEESERAGCCGSFSIEFGPSPGGFTYDYGFNYGH